MMRNKVRYFLIIASIILLIAQFFITDYSNFFSWENLLPFFSPVLLIIAMSGSIIHVKKHGENY